MTACQISHMRKGSQNARPPGPGWPGACLTDWGYQGAAAIFPRLAASDPAVPQEQRAPLKCRRSTCAPCRRRLSRSAEAGNNECKSSAAINNSSAQQCSASVKRHALPIWQKPQLDQAMGAAKQLMWPGLGIVLATIPRLIPQRREGPVFSKRSAWPSAPGIGSRCRLRF